MTEVEQKSFKAQLELYKRIKECDSMIIHTIQSNSSFILRELRDVKKIVDGDEKTYQLTEKQYDELLNLLKCISSTDGLNNLNAWIKESYITPKNESQKILSMLQ